MQVFHSSFVPNNYPELDSYPILINDAFKFMHYKQEVITSYHLPLTRCTGQWMS